MYMSFLQNIAAGGFLITPSDDNDLPETANGIRVGGAGDVAIETIQGDSLTLTVTAGESVYFKIRKVLSTGTTATALVGYRSA